MKWHVTFARLVMCVLLLGLATLVSAGPPPPGGDPPPGQVGFEPVTIQPGKLVVDPATHRITHAELTASPSASHIPAAKGDAPVSEFLRTTEFEGRTFHALPDRPLRAEDMLLGGSVPGGGDQISAAASTVITTENFEGTFPTGSWVRSGTHWWDDVGCFPVEGSRSAWPAANVADPCSAANYPTDMEAWLKYGPFSLADAQTATLDFFFRIDSQSCDPITDCDFLYWGASNDQITYYGDFVAGTHTGGLFQNSYNFASLDLSAWAGESQVWIAFVFASNADATTGKGAFIDLVSLRKNTDPRRYITDENFDVDDFPNPRWISLEGGGPEEYFWDDVPCFSRSGFWSMWPADEGANGRNPCPPAQEMYGNNMNSWLVHGPFGLSGASEAWIDFYFRNQSEPNYDKFWWTVSVDDQNYWGHYISGDYVVGPYGNGYNLMRFNLRNVPTLGDIRGASQVWLAFIFESDGSVINYGPFLDDVSVVIEAPVREVYLPSLIRSPQITRLYITNQTGGSLTYTVFGTPEGNKTCVVGNNQEKLCATFTAGTYDWRAQAVCGTRTGTRTYLPGDDRPKPFQCQ